MTTLTSPAKTVTDPAKKETLAVKPLSMPVVGYKSSLSGINIKAIISEMPEILSDIENGRRIQVILRKKYFRKCVREIRTVTEHCTKKEFEEIAQKNVRLYPNALEDRIGEIRVGTGYDSLMKQLISRNENLNRTPSNAENSQNTTNSLQAVTPKASKKRKTDNYGCVNWGPILTASETESQEKLRRELQDMYGLVEGGDWTKVFDGMEQAYGLLRQHINEGTSLQQLLVDWPFFLENNVVAKHCEILLGLKVPDQIESAYLKKAPLLMRYFKTKQTDLGMATFISQLEEERAKNNYQAILQGVIVCIQKCLGEKENSLMFPVNEMASNEEIEDANTESWPRIAMLGESNFAAQQFALLVDKKVVGRYTSFLTAISMLFSSFYLLNIEYPKEATSTLEFIQRCFVGINPGMKTAKRKKAFCVNARVLSFINQLSDFQWME